MKLNKDFPHRLYLDKRVLVNGIKRNNVNYENHIELRDWIQDLIDNEELEIPCTCEQENTCTIKATNNAFKFLDNGLSYQFLDVADNDIFRSSSLTDIQIEIVDDTQLSNIFSVSIFISQFYPIPIIKLIKPSSSEAVGNIDTIETFTYKISAKCGSNGIESNIATVFLLPTSVNLEQYINNNP